MAVSKEYYKDLSAEELMQDEFFINSVKTPDESTDTFWKDFLLEYPHKKEDVAVARDFVRNLKFFYHHAAPDAEQRVWNHIVAASKDTGRVVSLASWRRWTVAAAVAGIVLTAAMWFFLQNGNFQKESTQYGEVKQVILPDQSIVVLNAHSGIEYKKNWQQGEVREVWLKGEAFFDVKHLHRQGQPIKAADRFVVHAGEATVEVLGTSFNVSDREAVTKVVLQTGRVRVDFRNKETASVVMEPGEMVQFDRQSGSLVKEKTLTEKHTSWKKREFLLDHTSVGELINVIENTYGYKVVIEGVDILNRQLSGTGKISLENEQTLFRSLELMLEVQITKTDGTLYIRKK